MEADHTQTFENVPKDPSYTAPSTGETFEQKRKRQDLQETIWLRARQPPREDNSNHQHEERQKKKGEN